MLALVRAQAAEALEPGTTLLQISAFLNAYCFSRKNLEVFQLLVKIHPIKLHLLNFEG